MSSTRIPAGPFELVKANDGTTFPYYIIPFDKKGHCVAPETRAHLLAAAPAYTDIFFFSHGWNNDWEAATNRYREFISGYQAQRDALSLPAPPDFRPLLVGIFWPSQTMVWFERETGPDMASHGANTMSAVAAAAAAEALVADIGADLAPNHRDRFYALSQAEALNAGEARELADLLIVAAAPDMEQGDARDAEDLLMAAGADAALAAAQDGAAAHEPDYDDIGATRGPVDASLAAAGWLDKLDPRNLIKPFTVWQMKDRAGVVGRSGVSALLDGLLNDSTAKLHLFGHSYGCKVVMEALCAIQPDRMAARQVHSVTLLQAAFSHSAFAANLPEAPGTRGGFNVALARVKGPVVATFSADDTALHVHFHLALRRKEDYGELRAAVGKAAEAPPKYGALGGFGPQPVGDVLALQPRGEAYVFKSGGQVLGIQSTGKVTSHGDINNVHTWWLAYSNVNADHSG